MSGTQSLSVPFNGIDGLMYGLDEPRRPQTIELEVALRHRLRDDRLRQAVVTAADRHPMARARQRPAKPFDLNDTWAIDSDLAVDPVEVRDAPRDDIDTVRSAFSSRHIGLDTAPPFRVLLVHEPGGDRVMLSVNHAGFDGIGAIRLLQSISRAYAGQDDPLPDVDPIAVRGLLDQGRVRGSRAPTAAPPGSLDLTPTTRLAADESSGAGGFGILHLDLDVDDAAPPSGATVNDVLMAAMHLAVEQWNRANGAPCGRVAVMRPVNQRPASWRDEVLVNLVTAARIVSTPADRARPQRLVKAVAGQTRAVKADGGSAALGLARTSRTPVVLRRLLPHIVDAMGDRMADTAVLSNLGRVADPPWFGGRGRGLWFSPPPRDPVILTVGAATVDDRLGISLRWCRSALSADAARRFADTFITALGTIRLSA